MRLNVKLRKCSKTEWDKCKVEKKNLHYGSHGGQHLSVALVRIIKNNNKLKLANCCKKQEKK